MPRDPKFKTGARPTHRAKLAYATPYRRMVAVPPSCFIFPKKMSMWLNDQYGDCVTAEEAFNKACAGIWITDQTVLDWCNANDTLNGANLQPVIQQMQAKGFSQDGDIYGDGNGLAVDYSNAPLLQSAIYEAAQEGSCIKLGIAAAELPSDAGNVNGWFLTNDKHDTDEDHCTAACGYGTAQQFVDAMNAAFGLTLTVPSGIDANAQGYAMFTWKTIGWVAVTAFVNMVGEAWKRSPGTVKTGSGTPQTVEVYSTVTPTPPPPPPPPPPPVPAPVSTLQEVIDFLFKMAEAASPFGGKILLMVQKWVDAYFAANPSEAHKQVECYFDKKQHGQKTGSIQPVVDAFFAELIGFEGNNTIAVVLTHFAKAVIDAYIVSQGW